MAAPVSLLDLVPRPEPVEIAPGSSLEVRGLSVQDFAAIFGRFPEVGKMFAQRQFDAASLIAGLPHAMSAVIAAGIGRIGDQAEEEAARALPIGVQADILAAILRLTMPRGMSAFLELLEGLAPGAGAAFRRAQATNLSPQSTVSSPAVPTSSPNSSA